MNYRREIDGLRAVAVLPVMLFHAGISGFSGGFVGVDVFFVISGYLITTLILEEIAAGEFSIARFYERRARRILPALFLILLTTIPFAWWLLPPDELRGYFNSLAAMSLFSSNFLFWLESGYFDTAAEFKPLLHTWSLAVEEQYYLLFPPLLLLTWRFGKRLVVPMLAAVALASLGLAQWWSSTQPSAAFFLLPTRIWELLAGGLAAYMMAHKAEWFDSRLVGEVLGALGLALILSAVFGFDEHTPFPGVHALVPTLGTVLIVLFTAADTQVKRLLSVSPLVAIGLISYSAYLWHQPVLAFARMLRVDQHGTVAMSLLLGLVLVLAYSSWRFVERPFRDKRYFRPRSIFSFAVTGSLVLLGLGLLGSFGGDGLYRFTPSQLAAMAEVEAQAQRRQELVRSDECHFNGKTGIDIQQFMLNWDCWDDSASSAYQKIPLVVLGDSHAADLATALKSNGYLPLQVTGAGCSIDPVIMKDSCKLLYLRLKHRLLHDDYFKYLMLANAFIDFELSETALAQTLDYWERLGLKIIFVGGMPRFDQFKMGVLLDTDIAPDYSIADYSLRPEALALFASRDMEVIDRKKLFCSLTANCSYRDASGALLLVDQWHLSELGAKRFGAALLEQSPVLRGLTRLGR